MRGIARYPPWPTTPATVLDADRSLEDAVHQLHVDNAHSGRPANAEDCPGGRHDLIRWCAQRVVARNRMVMLRKVGTTIELVPFGHSEVITSASGESVDFCVPSCDIILVP